MTNLFYLSFQGGGRELPDAGDISWEEHREEQADKITEFSPPKRAIQTGDFHCEDELSLGKGSG